MVVSGMRGFYQAAGFAFGSVSQRLLAYAPCSLMLVPGKVTPGLGLRVMLATDGSPDALRAAGLIRDLPGVREIVVVCVVRPLGAAQAVLARPDVRGAVCLLSMEDVLRFGLPVDRCDRIERIAPGDGVRVDEAKMKRLERMIAPHIAMHEAACRT